MPIPTFPNGSFPGFRMEKKELVQEMKHLYDFPCFLMHIRPSDEISNYNKTKATCSKAAIKTLEQDMALSNGVLLFLLLSLNVFFT